MSAADPPPSPALPDAAWLAALSALPGIGPARLARLLDLGTPSAVWQAVCSADASVAQALGSFSRMQEVASAAQSIDPTDQLIALREANIGLVDRASAAFPEALCHDPEPPAVLFFDGDLGRVENRKVAIVGTRRCTRYGADLAFELGTRLAAAGVTVVSGLALGIDAAAHAGALAARGAAPMGVVAAGLDRPYPQQNAGLWRAVATSGAVVTEAPLGVRPERWRFPARNRIIAGLSEIVVVVESHDRGGSLYTAAQAIERDRPVLAVPGSIRSAASAGCNRLIADGCHPVCALDDVFEMLDLIAAPEPDDAPGPGAAPVGAGSRAVLEAFAWQASTFEQLVEHSGLDIVDVADALEELLASGMVVARGAWFERSASVRIDGPTDP